MTETITRPVMTARELAEHRVGSHGRDYRYSTDGFGDMAVANAEGWHAVASWGRDGWDLGDWPYVVVSTRRTGRPVRGNYHTDGRPWQVRVTVEGDTDVYAFATEEERDAAINYLFVWYGLSRGYTGPWSGLTERDRAALDAGTLQVPVALRGPYSD